ncbi:hypothetical protein [Thalassobellus citreus]|uniref:hypothetical protein n=1 Tax=Thalassobellus citreus TaxID=3367752 RepID=UPI0037A8897F
MNKYVVLLNIGLFFVSCKTLSIQNEQQSITTQNLQLGTVGEQKGFVLEQDYNSIALPKYEQPIKIRVHLVPFSKSTFKAYKKAKTFQNGDVILNYIDSVKTKPTFLKIEIADRIAVLNALNNQVNKDVLLFLKNRTQAHLVTSISTVFNQELTEALRHAEEVYLETSGINNYVLKTYKDKKQQRIILFEEGVMFAYQTSNACWKENDAHQLQLVDLVESNDSCPSKASRSAKEKKKKINYNKF